MLLCFTFHLSSGYAAPPKQDTKPDKEKPVISYPTDAELYPQSPPDAAPLTKERIRELRDRGIYSGFGPRTLTLKGKTKRFHKGIDISAPTGSRIMAFNDGIVVFSGTHRGYGINVIVRQIDGRLARYAHMSKSLSKAGDEVTRGTVIGCVGRTGRATGSHLHFELLDEGEYLDPAEHIWLASELIKTPQDIEQELALEREEHKALAARRGILEEAPGAAGDPATGAAREPSQNDAPAATPLKTGF